MSYGALHGLIFFGTVADSASTCCKMIRTRLFFGVRYRKKQRLSILYYKMKNKHCLARYSPDPLLPHQGPRDLTRASTEVSRLCAMAERPLICSLSSDMSWNV